ncbi:hypothetical protein [Albibacterium profundi]|uniref:Uncharacterized protein n=1 Tax=Albibacterium profundi TaxID=3134906 RepID=A0ABV5CIB4_9SPHI
MGILIGVGQTRPKFPHDYYYGIEFDTEVASPTCTRIGRPELHVSLPVQSRMRGCLLNDNGTVRYYLNPNDWSRRDTGSASDLTGAHGQVMIEVPESFWRFEYEGTKRRVLISEHSLPGFYKVPTFYISAYEATINRTNNKLSSVANMSPDYRGGNNSATNDAASNTLLGKPATATSLIDFRAYAQNRGAKYSALVYDDYKYVAWLFHVEYATLNSQLPFTSQPTSEGYKQGGLGDGVTNLNSTLWSNFSSYYPVIPCGHSDSLGNKSGEVAYTMPVEYDASGVVTYVNRYRGIENPFGHIYKFADGINILIQSDAEGGQSQMFVCSDPALFTHLNNDNYEFRGLLPRESGVYIKEMLMGEKGDYMPFSVVGASATTFFCDRFYTTIPETGDSMLAVLFGGSSLHGASAGFGISYASYSASSTNASIGSRLCCRS